MSLDRTIEMTAAATETLMAMRRQVQDGHNAAAGWDWADKAVKQERSLYHCLLALLTGPTEHLRVLHDYELSLVCIEANGFTFGVNFHRDKHFDGTRFEGKFGEWSLNS